MNDSHFYPDCPNAIKVIKKMFLHCDKTYNSNRNFLNRRKSSIIAQIPSFQKQKTEAINKLNKATNRLNNTIKVIEDFKELFLKSNKR